MTRSEQDQKIHEDIVQSVRRARRYARIKRERQTRQHEIDFWSNVNDRKPAVEQVINQLKFSDMKQVQVKNEKIQAAYTVVIRNNRFEIGLAHAGVKGYSPGYGILENQTYDEAKKFVDELNEKKYGHSPKEAGMIVASTM